MTKRDNNNLSTVYRKIVYLLLIQHTYKKVDLALKGKISDSNQLSLNPLEEALSIRRHSREKYVTVTKTAARAITGLKKSLEH